MNHLFHQFSWHQYLGAALTIAIIYYLAVLLRCYRPELQNVQRRISGEQDDNTLAALQYQGQQDETAPATSDNRTEKPQQEEPQITENDMLAGELRASIAQAADKPFAPAILLPKIRQILQKYNASALDRAMINHLIVNECEKTGTALLTEEEVDQWWSV
jgi:hypothetical protein